jgi:15-cis-phytoene synthase
MAGNAPERALSDANAALPPLSRLALAYAPDRARLPTLALLALDARLAGIVRNAREPLLAQVRLAWWRERLAEPVLGWPAGEPLLTALASWQGNHTELGALVDAWEGLVDPPPLSAAEFTCLAEARAVGFGALAALVAGEVNRTQAERLAQGWALADLAAGLSHPEELAAVAELIAERDWSRAALPRALRPLTVLHGLAARSVRKNMSLRDMSPAALVLAMRLGLFGR